MKKSLLIEAQDILNSLIIEAENPSAFKDALALMTDSMVTAFEEWEDRYANTGRWQRENSLFAMMRDKKKNPFEGYSYTVTAMGDFIATALCDENFEGYQGTRVKSNGMSYKQIPSDAIKPEFKQIVSSWSSLQKVCNYAAKNAYWRLYKKYKNAEGVDWITKDSYNRWKNDDGKVNIMLLKLDWFFRAKSQRGVWGGAYKPAEFVKIDENNLGWPITRAIKEGIAKLHQKAYDMKKAEDDAWHEEFSRGLNSVKGSGNRYVEADRAEEFARQQRRFGRRY